MNLRFEQQWWRKARLVAGVDEVGRGCLAGPVVVGAAVFSPDHIAIEGVNDSKKLSVKKRELLVPIIRNQALAVGIGEVSAKAIDQIGIVAAIRRAADMALKQILIKTEYVIVSDGPRPIHSPILGVKSEAVVDGDALIYTIAAASVVAKVYRDRLMCKEAEKFDQYGWETNVGYGTKTHREAVQKFGLTPLHRRSFCKSLC